jgi:FkbM family methyltransferase
MISKFIDMLRQDGIDLVDIGSSGSLDSRWDPIKEIINLVGFDPNQEDCARQNANPSQYKSSNFLPYALHGIDGVETLYITRSIYCYSLLKPNKPWLDRFAFRELFDLIGEEKIQVKAIDKVTEIADFSPDVIKIDVQGLELPILSKAGHLLDSCFFVETETGFTENYIGETTFSQLDRFMQENDFLMFDINTSHRIARNNRFKDSPSGHEQILWAEATWLRDYVGMDQKGKFDAVGFNTHKARKVLVLCALQQCYDFGYELAGFFHHKGFLSAEEYEDLGEISAWHIHDSPSKSASDPSVNLQVKVIVRLLNMMPLKARRAISRAVELSLSR